MFRYLIKLRNKPESEKKKILVIIVLIIMSLVVFSWVRFKKDREEKSAKLGSLERSSLMIDTIFNKSKVFFDFF